MDKKPLILMLILSGYSLSSSAVTNYVVTTDGFNFQTNPSPVDLKDDTGVQKTVPFSQAGGSTSEGHVITASFKGMPASTYKITLNLTCFNYPYKSFTFNNSASAVGYNQDYIVNLSLYIDDQRISTQSACEYSDSATLLPPKLSSSTSSIQTDNITLNFLTGKIKSGKHTLAVAADWAWSGTLQGQGGEYKLWFLPQGNALSNIWLSAEPITLKAPQ